MNTFTLSLAAVDVLWQDLKLGARPYPLEFSYHGRTNGERRAIRTGVLRDLEAKGLAQRGRPVPEVEDALSVLARFEFALSAGAKLDQQGERMLLARGAAAGEFAVLATIDQQVMRVDLVRRSSLLRAVVDLAPPNRPGPGQSVTLSSAAAVPAARSAEVDVDGMFQSAVSAPRTRQDQQLRAAQVIMERPRVRGGHFVGYLRDRGGRVARTPEVGWFDTDLGRYLMQSQRQQDGHNWITMAPADNAKIANQVNQNLNSLRQR